MSFGYARFDQLPPGAAVVHASDASGPPGGVATGRLGAIVTSGRLDSRTRAAFGWIVETPPVWNRDRRRWGCDFVSARLTAQWIVAAQCVPAVPHVERVTGRKDFRDDYPHPCAYSVPAA